MKTEKKRHIYELPERSHGDGENGWRKKTVLTGGPRLSAKERGEREQIGSTRRRDRKGKKGGLGKEKEEVGGGSQFGPKGNFGYFNLFFNFVKSNKSKRFLE